MLKMCIRVTSHALDPLPCHKLSHLLGPLPPSSVTYFMDGPKADNKYFLAISYATIERFYVLHKITSNTFVLLDILFFHVNRKDSKKNSTIFN